MVDMDIIEEIKSRLGAIPSPWDYRHYRVRMATPLQVAELPEEYDELLDYAFLDPWPDQGDIGSCVGWDGSIVMEITNHLLDLQPDDISAGWLYHWSRKYAKIPEWQEGSTNLGLMKALNKLGATTEACCPTDTKAPWDGINPCEGVNDPDSPVHPSKFAIDQYWMVNPNPNDIKAAIYGLTHKFPYKMPDGSPGKGPLVSAYPVYESFKEAYDNGIVPMPKKGEKFLGGHSSAIIGWKKIDGETYFINLNSWGDEVGDGGLFYLPENYPFYPHDFWLIHNGPPTESPFPSPSTCNVGKTAAKIASVLPWLLRRRGRFYYLNPD